MAKDVSMRSKKMELFDKLHLGMDHVLAKLLLDAPRLPSALKLQTETQSLGTTWVQVTELFEKRKAMMRRRKEKEKRRNEKRRHDARAKQEKEEKKRNDKESKPTKPRDSSRETVVGSSEHEREKIERKASKADVRASSQGPKLVATGWKDEGHDHVMLKKLRKLPGCRDLSVGSKKYKALVKWIELDRGENARTSPELMELLDTLQLQPASENKRKTPTPSRKRPLEPLDKQKAVRKEVPSRKKRVAQREDDVDDSDDEGSASDEAEFVPDVESKSKENTRLADGTTHKVETREEGTPAGSTKEQDAAKPTASSSPTRYLSYGNPLREAVVVPAGTSPDSAIVLEDSEEENTQDEDGVDDSSTDDEDGRFDLNEDDVFVWMNQESAVWESRSTLPTKTQVWLDKVLGATSIKKRRDTKAAKQFVYQ
ncbi:hypothetical protein PsorP6_017996 [Peronosclerospora sorghi]|uniref:Uncharacterized protein n=1 Tax=Peronosclerospora sorghi TaxID=230839 RepID=A0ACC0WDV4_9STRA|nr:hypothetical protein PsorP6_017996 [Peronosclerospora sorghi]